jgi:uncharacterized membrane protein YqiK
VLLVLLLLVLLVLVLLLLLLLLLLLPLLALLVVDEEEVLVDEADLWSPDFFVGTDCEEVGYRLTSSLLQ